MRYGKVGTRDHLAGAAVPAVGPYFKSHDDGLGSHTSLGAGGAKAKDFGQSFRRLIGTLKPEMGRIVAVIVMAAISVSFTIAGPKILGTATNQLFSGVVGKMVSQQAGDKLPAGITKDQLLKGLKAKLDASRAAGEKIPDATKRADALAKIDSAARQMDMLANLDFTPGKGVDFAAVGRILLMLIGVYVLAAFFSWAQGFLMAGVSQRTVYRMRSDVDAKLDRLPLAYFDRNTRGDILSRVTNDIDNIANSLQQSLTQLITAVLTIVGVLAMMFSISWLLAVISLLILPMSAVVTIQIAKRSQKQFALQWERTGDLNGHVEEMHSGHSIVKMFGHQKEAIEVFRERNEKLYDASFRAQFISGIIQPSMMFLGNLNYVAIAVIGGLRVASGQLSLGDVQAFIQYSRQFTWPITQLASIANVMFVVGSAEKIPWEENFFDKVLSVESFYYYPDQDRALHELFRVLAPRGRVFILINLYKDNPYSLRWVEEGRTAVVTGLYDVKSGLFEVLSS